MIRVRSVYESGEWKLTGKLSFDSRVKSYSRSAYFLSPPAIYYNVNRFAPKFLGGKPHTIGAKCLTVWSK